MARRPSTHRQMRQNPLSPSGTMTMRAVCLGYYTIPPCQAVHDGYVGREQAIQLSQGIGRHYSLPLPLYDIETLWRVMRSYAAKRGPL